MRILNINEMTTSEGDIIIIEILFGNNTHWIRLFLGNDGTFSPNVDEELKNKLDGFQTDALNDLIDGFRKFMLYR